MFDDSTLNIDWQIPKNEMLISEKDLINPSFEKADKF